MCTGKQIIVPFYKSLKKELFAHVRSILFNIDYYTKAPTKATFLKYYRIYNSKLHNLYLLWRQNPTINLFLILYSSFAEVAFRHFPQFT